MGYYVIEGEFDRYLTRPLGVLYQFFFTNINIFGITDLIPGILVILYGCVKCQIHVTGWFLLEVFLIYKDYLFKRKEPGIRGALKSLFRTKREEIHAVRDLSARG